MVLAVDQTVASQSVVLALGLFLTTLWQSFGLVVTGMFLAASGGAFVGPLIFYAVAVKGYTRYKGALIGFLGLVFTVSGIIGVGVDVGGDWATVPFIGWFVLPVLAGGILLFLLLPRWFSANYGPGPTLRETIAHPGAKFQIAWVAAVFLVASMIIGSETTHIRYIVRAPVPISYEPGFGYQVVGRGFGIGALLWGAASDFIPVRWLLIGLAFLSLPAAACLRLLDDPAVGVLFLSLLRSGLVGLPWVLMAESLPANHVAKLALIVAWVAGSLGGSLGLLYWTSAFYVWGWTRSSGSYLLRSVCWRRWSHCGPGFPRLCGPAGCDLFGRVVGEGVRSLFPELRDSTAQVDNEGHGRYSR